MFKSYASKITSFLIENKEINQDDYEVYKYGFEVLIAFIVNIAIVLSIGLLFLNCQFKSDKLLMNH